MVLIEKDDGVDDLTPDVGVTPVVDDDGDVIDDGIGGVLIDDGLGGDGDGIDDGLGGDLIDESLGGDLIDDGDDLTPVSIPTDDVGTFPLLIDQYYPGSTIVRLPADGLLSTLFSKVTPKNGVKFILTGVAEGSLIKARLTKEIMYVEAPTISSSYSPVTKEVTLTINPVGDFFGSPYETPVDYNLSIFAIPLIDTLTDKTFILRKYNASDVFLNQQNI